MKIQRNIILLSIALAAGCASTAPPESFVETQQLLESPQADALKQEQPRLLDDAHQAMKDAEKAINNNELEEAKLYTSIARSRYESAINLSNANQYKARRSAMAQAAYNLSNELTDVKSEAVVVKRYNQLEVNFDEATKKLDQYKGQEQEARKVIAEARKLQGEAVKIGAGASAPNEYNQGQLYIESGLQQLDGKGYDDAIALAKKAKKAFADSIAMAKNTALAQRRQEEAEKALEKKNKELELQRANAKADAQKSLDLAVTARINALGKDGDTKAPSVFQMADYQMEQAQRAFDRQRYERSIALAQTAADGYKVAMDTKPEPKPVPESPVVVAVTELAEKSTDPTADLDTEPKKPKIVASIKPKAKPEPKKVVLEPEVVVAVDDSETDDAATQTPGFVAQTQPGVPGQGQQRPGTVQQYIPRPQQQGPYYGQPYGPQPYGPQYGQPYGQPYPMQGPYGQGFYGQPPAPYPAPYPMPYQVQSPYPMPVPYPVPTPYYAPQQPQPAPQPQAQPVQQAQPAATAGQDSELRQQVVRRLSEVQMRRAELLGQSVRDYCPAAFDEFEAILEIAQDRLSSNDLMLAMEYLVRADERIRFCNSKMQGAPMLQGQGPGPVERISPPKKSRKRRRRLQKQVQDLVQEDDQDDDHEDTEPPVLKHYSASSQPSAPAQQPEKATVQPAPTQAPATQTVAQPAPTATVHQPAPQPVAPTPAPTVEVVEVPVAQPPVAQPPAPQEDPLLAAARNSAVHAINQAELALAQANGSMNVNPTRRRAARQMVRQARTQYEQASYANATVMAERAIKTLGGKLVPAPPAPAYVSPVQVAAPSVPQAQYVAPQPVRQPAVAPAPVVAPQPVASAAPAPAAPAPVAQPQPATPTPFAYDQRPQPQQPQVVVVEQQTPADVTVAKAPTQACVVNESLVNMVNDKQREVATTPEIRQLIVAANQLNDASRCADAATFYRQALTQLFSVSTKRPEPAPAPAPVAPAPAKPGVNEFKSAATVSLSQAEQKKVALANFSSEPSYQVGDRLLEAARERFRANDFETALLLSNQAIGSFDGVNTTPAPAAPPVVAQTQAPEPAVPAAPGDARDYRREYNAVLDALVARDRARDRMGEESRATYERGIDFLAKARRAWSIKDYQGAGRLAVEAKTEFDSIKEAVKPVDNSAELEAQRKAAEAARQKADADKQLADKKKQALDALQKARQARRDCEAQSCLARDERTYRDAVGRINDAETAIATEQFDIVIEISEDAAKKFNSILAKPAPMVSDSPYLTIEGDQLRLRPRITFATGSTTIDGQSIPSLDAAANFLKKFASRITAVNVAGYTDSVGNAGKNQRLSADRADAVARALKAKGVELKITSVGYGENNPIASNKTKDGREQNRRVEIRFKSQEN